MNSRKESIMTNNRIYDRIVRGISSEIAIIYQAGYIVQPGMIIIKDEKGRIGIIGRNYQYDYQNETVGNLCVYEQHNDGTWEWRVLSPNEISSGLMKELVEEVQKNLFKKFKKIYREKLGNVPLFVDDDVSLTKGERLRKLRNGLDM